MDDTTPTTPARPRPARRGREPGSPRAAGIAWAATILMVILIAMLQALGGKESLATDPEAPVASAPEPEAPIAPGAIFETSAKYAVWSSQDRKVPVATRRQAVTSLDAFAADPYDDVRIAIVAGEAVDAEDALERLDAIEQTLRQDAERRAERARAEDGGATPDAPAPDGLDTGAQDADARPAEAPAIPHDLAEDISTLRTLYVDGRTAVGAGERQRFVERYEWFGRLAFVQGLPEDDPVRLEVLAPAARAGRIILGGLLGAGVLGVIGFGLFITAIVLLATGALRLRFRAPEPGGSAGIETFALFLVAFMLVQAAMGFMMTHLGEAAAPFAQLLIWLLVLVPLWPLLRGGTLAGLRQSLGWNTGEGVFRELRAGLLGYLGGLPVVGAGILLTVLAMAIDTFVRSMTGGGPAEPPSHPLPDQLGAGGPLIAIQLVLMATVWAPLVEESHFRGALYSHLRGRLHPILAGLVTAFIFAAIHPQGVLAIPALMSLGFVFAMLREWRGSLIAPMMAHALNNGMLVAMMLILFRG